MKLSKLLNLSLTIFGLEFLTSTTIEPTTNEILFKPLGNLIPELSWATIRTKINITDMFKETEQLCRAAIILDREYLRMGNKFNGKEVRTKISPKKFKQYTSIPSGDTCRRYSPDVHSKLNQDTRNN